jgi:catecholate siderophore receptor
MSSRPHLSLLAALAATAATTLAAHAQSPGAGAAAENATRDSARTLQAVEVRANRVRRSSYGARRISSATRTEVPLLDVPQSVSVVGSGLIADLSMQSMSDVLRYVPGVTMGQGEGHRDAPTIRGNASTADFYVDGVRDDAQYLRDVYNVERVEALKGSNAMVFGRGGGGGVINRVTKDAQWATTRSLTLEGGSFGHRRGTVDVGGALGAHAAARLNGVYENSALFRHGTDRVRAGVNPTAAFSFGGTVVRAGYEFFDDRRTVDRGVPSFRGLPSAAGIRTFFGDPDASHASATVHSAGLTIERGERDGLHLRNHTRGVSYDKFYQNVFPGAVDAAGTKVTISGYNNRNDRRNLFNQTDVTYAVATGPVTQTLLVGVEAGRQDSENFRNTGYFDGSATSMLVPFDQPTITAPVSWRQSATDADNHVRAGVLAGYVQDQIALGRYVQAVLGVRWDRFDVRFHNDRDGQELRKTDHMLSPRAGLVLKPIAAMSFYGTYSVSHLPSSGDQFSSLTATTKTLEPEQFVNREAGFKWEPRADLAVTGAAYRLERSNTVAPSAEDPTKLVQTGRQRTSGAELGITGNVTSAWQLAGGYAMQRATIVERTSAARAGATVPLVPHHTLSLWNRYQIVPRVAAGVGVLHQARSYAAIDNAVMLPEFTRVDGAAFVTLRQGLKAQVNVENVLNARYYATSHGNNNIMPGAPRTLRVSLTVAP